MPVVTTAPKVTMQLMMADSGRSCRTHSDTPDPVRIWRAREPNVIDDGARLETGDARRPLNGGGIVEDTEVLKELNEWFVDAFRRGSWELLEPILSPSFSYLDGATGEVWDQERYIEDLRRNPQPTIGIAQVVVHVDGDVAIVSARSSTAPTRSNRYIDTYERREDGWVCVHACVWPLRQSDQ
jgi:Domain of unknown function (DUF4440)